MFIMGDGDNDEKESMARLSKARSQIHSAYWRCIERILYDLGRERSNERKISCISGVAELETVSSAGSTFRWIELITHGVSVK